MNITEGGLSDPDVIALLGEHLQGMWDHSPPESIHALDVEGLKAPDITFWTMRDGNEVLGCIALKQLDARHKGVAAALLEHLIAEARRRSYERLSLETGSGPAFEAAHTLYRKYGFIECGPFADYREDPFSRFMTAVL
jgi:putative acetyltransferase